MLKEVLRIIYEKRMYSASYIAKELNISEDMANMAKGQLVDRGYLLEEEAATCSSGCGSCPMGKSCSQTPLLTYQITDKGKNILN